MNGQIPKKCKCLMCNSVFTLRGISRHIKSCLQKTFERAEEKEIRYLLLHVISCYPKGYFLYLLVKESAKLRDLDAFLRDIWLECCGHMSAFFLGYYNEVPKNRKIGQLSEIRQDIIYHYDFGSTTELKIRIIGEYMGPSSPRRKVLLLARNAPPIIYCDSCGKREATKICIECKWNDKGFLCDECAAKHPCDPQLSLPVCNSPRMGVCGYEGEYRKIDVERLMSNFLKHLDCQR